MLEIGSLIDGKYKVLNKIGQGGMSVVYLAMNEKVNKQWAIKEVRKEGVKDFDVVKQSLIAELELLKKLNHPSLPSIVDVIETEGTFLIVMDYIEGIPLNRALAEYGAQKQEDVIQWGIQLCEVLIYLHSRTPAIIYRDMKPSNIMLKPDGNVVLIDFGTAREFKESNNSDTTCLGTKGYAAPEQFGGKGQTDVRTDIYSLGTTLYHLVTGKNPSAPPYELKPIREWNSSLSTGLEKIINKCIQPNPEDRYQTASHMLFELEHINEIDDKYKRKQKKRLAFFIVTLVSSIFMFSVSLYSNQKRSSLIVEDYNNIIESAKKIAGNEPRFQLFSKAVLLEPKRKEAYEYILQDFKEDCLFSGEEEKQLLTLLQETTRSGNTNIQYLKENSLDYGSFCYSLGNLYWYYYYDKGDKHKRSSAWFEDALNYGKLKANDYRKAELFKEIGFFHKKVRQLEHTSVFQGEYSAYWNTLNNIMDEFTKNPEDEAIMLQLYSEIVDQVFNYRSYFKVDGVKEQDIINVLDLIDQKSFQFELIQVSKKKEIEELHHKIKDTKTIVQSAYMETSYSVRD